MACQGQSYKEPPTLTVYIEFPFGDEEEHKFKSPLTVYIPANKILNVLLEANRYYRLVGICGGEDEADALIKAVEGRFTINQLCDMLLAGMTEQDILEYK